MSHGRMVDLLCCATFARKSGVKKGIRELNVTSPKLFLVKSIQNQSFFFVAFFGAWLMVVLVKSVIFVVFGACSTKIWGSPSSCNDSYICCNGCLCSPPEAEIWRKEVVYNLDLTYIIQLL